MSDARERLAISLDVDDLEEARRLAARLSPWFATAKVGFELYAVAGPAAFDTVHDVGLRVFADLKLHDIPTTVERSARALGRRGVEFLNLHATGGVDMLRAGVCGLKEGAHDAGHAPPIALGVTVLTSDVRADAFDERLAWSRDAGCDGVVCATSEVARAAAMDMRTMVPGIRLSGQAADDQARVATPSGAIEAGADWLVIGRAVTRAPDPEAAAAAVAAEVDAALHG
jgi:orotidine-5'-phosphate decarboxylase